MDGRPGTWMGVSNCVMSPAKWSDVASKGAKDTILFTIFVEGTYLKSRDTVYENVLIEFFQAESAIY